MFDLESRKRVTKQFVEYIETEVLRITKNRGLACMLIMFFHIVVMFSLFYIIIWSQSVRLVSIGTIIWLTIIFQHWYFGGCWFVRCERKILNTKEWYGPWTLLFKFCHKLGMPNNAFYHEKVFLIFALLLTYIAFFRIQKLKKI